MLLTIRRQKKTVKSPWVPAMNFLCPNPIINRFRLRVSVIDRFTPPPPLKPPPTQNTQYMKRHRSFNLINASVILKESDCDSFNCTQLIKPSYPPPYLPPQINRVFAPFYVHVRLIDTVYAMLNSMKL